MNKPDTIRADAEDQLGAPYVYGTWGKAKCSVSLRKRYAGYSPSQAAITYKRCQAISSDGKKTCATCTYNGRLAFDCRGFTHWLLERVGITISGQAVGTQWSGKGNWIEKGDIAAMPDLVCCVFIREKDGKWSHTGVHIGGGQIIHCSGEVKRDTLGSGRNWTHYAIPAGLYTADEIKKAHEERGIFMRTLKNGSQGEDVRALQEMLNKLGFSCGKADGIFGKNTEAAVKAFQAINGLTCDGIAGPQTLKLLAARAADPDTPELPEDDDEHDPSAALVPLTYAEALTVRDALKKALAVIEKALQ